MNAERALSLVDPDIRERLAEPRNGLLILSWEDPRATDAIVHGQIDLAVRKLGWRVEATDRGLELAGAIDE